MDKPKQKKPRKIVFGRIPKLDLVLFAKHLSLMLKAGLPLSEAIATVREQADSRRLKTILTAVGREIERGGSLGESLGRYPDFDNLFINMIKVGEESGTLEQNLEHSALQLEKTHLLKRKVKAALIYPVLILVMAFGLAAVLTLFILPKLVPLFRSLHVALPLPTRILMASSRWLQTHPILFLSSPLVAVAFFRIMRGYAWFRKMLEWLWLHTPVLGRIVRKVNLAHFARTLSILLASGITIVEALGATADSFKNIHYRERLHVIAREVTGGTSISSHLKQTPLLFPAVVARMVEVGEKTGNLETTLSYLSDFYEQEVDETLKSLSSILEPVLLMVIGAAVGFIALSILSPIYQITKGLQI